MEISDIRILMDRKSGKRIELYIDENKKLAPVETPEFQPESMCHLGTYLLNVKKEEFTEAKGYARLSLEHRCLMDAVYKAKELGADYLFIDMPFETYRPDESPNLDMLLEVEEVTHIATFYAKNRAFDKIFNTFNKIKDHLVSLSEKLNSTESEKDLKKANKL